MATSRRTKALGVQGTRLTLDGKPFYYQGLSFFNGLYNPEFNNSDEDRMHWLGKFKANGINALRVRCLWDFPPPRHHVDLSPDAVMFTHRGELRQEPFRRLARLLEQADSLDMVVGVGIFSMEAYPYYLQIPAQEQATREITEALRPYGNLFLQIWVECDIEWKRSFDILKSIDPDRVTSDAPGRSYDHKKPFDHIGTDEMNRALDILTPHTLRTEAFPFWYLAPAQVEYLIDTYQKPVIDDSPARSGLLSFGGIPGGTTPGQHIEHCRRVRAIGGYYSYHHDMFQNGYGHPMTPPNGIPDPDFSPFHRKVFDYLRDHPTW